MFLDLIPGFISDTQTLEDRITKIDVKRYRYRNKPFPPKTTRYCRICSKKTKWEYNKKTGHSECMKCGFRKISDRILATSDGRIIKIYNDRDE